MLQGKGSRPEAGGPWSVFSDQELSPALRGRRDARRVRGKEGERGVAPETSFLNFKCPCTPWLSLYRSGKAARPLRAKRRGPPDRQVAWGPAPPGAPQALRTTVHTDPAAPGRHTPVCTDTQPQEGSEPAEVVGCKQNQQC